LLTGYGINKIFPGSWLGSILSIKSYEEAFIRMKTWKRLGLGLATMLMAVALTACGSDKKDDKAKADSNSGKTLGIAFTTAANKDDPYYVTATKFKELVEKKSNGKIKVEVYAGGQLGSETEMWESMQAGTLDMGVMTNAYTSVYVPANGCLDLPFIFKDNAQARKILDGDFGKKLLENGSAKSGVTMLAFSEGGFRQLCTRDKGVAKPADLKGMKIRCMETKTYLSAYKALGVNATPMAWGELLTALQQGTVDGCDAPLSVLYTNGFPDVCKYIDNVNLFYSPLPVCISTTVFNKFSPEEQKLLREAAVEAGKEARKHNDETAKMMEDDLTKKGMKIIREIDTKGFQEEARKCWDEMDSYAGGTWVKDLRKAVGVN
jgi:tripartite ATP-independent transporter DctP family solute receptor